MKFSRLRLSGFKSFVEPTELHIEPGLTGIVGPNGCGKSNLLEALRWVMGENSFKNMRGTGMEDVIFAGTNTRPARNHAEVTLIMDNSDRTGPAAYNGDDSIEVIRRIEKDKGSNYKINAKDARARDVQLLFADASTGSHSPALVSQGKIGQLISSKPINRRRILEEAAGITGLYTRRHEAELRLRAAETNLTRLDDVMTQYEGQLASLKKQARQATRYRNLSGHIRQAESIVLHLRWSHAKNILETEEARLKDTDTRVREYTEASSAASVAQALASQKLPELRDAEAAAAAALHRLTIEKENLDSEEQRARQQAAQLEARIAQVAQDLEREIVLVADTDGALQRLEAEETTLRSEDDAQGDSHEKAAEQVKQSDTALREEEAKLDALSKEAAEHGAQRQSLEQSARQSDQRIGKLVRQLEEIAREKAGLAAVEAKKQEIAQHSDELEEALAIVKNAEASSVKAEEVIKAARATEADAREPMAAAEKELERLSAEIKALSNLLAVDDGGLWPPVIDTVTVEPGYETALGAALGEDLTVPTDTAAPVHWDALPAIDNPAILPDGVVSLAKFVDGPPALTRRLSHIGVVSKEQGKVLQASLKGGQRLVSQDGDLWRWDGYTAAAEAPTAAAKRLEQRNRLADLEDEIGDARSLARSKRDDFETARLVVQESTQQESDARKALRTTQGDESRIRNALALAERQASSQIARLGALSEADERLRPELEDAKTTLAEANAGLSELQPDDALRERLGDVRAQVGELRIALTEARASLEGLNRDAQVRSRRLDAITQERDAWLQRSGNADQQISTLKERQTGATTELADVKQIPGRVEASRRSLLTKISEADTKRTQTADLLAASEQKLSEADKLLRETQHALSETREERARIDGLVDGARERKADTEARIREILDCAAAQALAKAELKEGEELPPLDKIEAKLDRLKRERENLGGVNLRADEEAAEITEQFDTMVREREDLEEAISKLRQGIGSLNKEGRERMLEAFETVNTNFTRLFTHLFGGGTAHLALTESDDPLEAGLEIMARPPGKRMQNMSLLSGGEQALTAMSLIFAVFLTNPSPICVLDEVDAPLDDANVERFCDLMEEMVRTTETRFLIITHHALTMARMHRLFGVTMQERGVSTLVSVDLAAADELLEAS